MSKFNVEVKRISYSTRMIEVEADSVAEAKEKALIDAGDLEFSEHDADYEVSWVGKQDEK